MYFVDKNKVGAFNFQTSTGKIRMKERKDTVNPKNILSGYKTVKMERIERQKQEDGNNSNQPVITIYLSGLNSPVKTQRLTI